MKLRIIVGVIVLILICSCKTYTIPVTSFKEQMLKSHRGNMKEVKVNDPLFSGNIKYYSNNIDRILVVDRDGEKLYLDNSPSIEMRVTHRNGKKYIVYFDTVIIENDTLKGGRSRFIQKLTRQIPMDSIIKIEVQNGGKKFNYKS